MISINLNKAKAIAHEYRREKRSELLVPLDAKTLIPVFSATAEQERQVIREKFAVIQQEIDAAESLNDLQQLIENI